MDREAMQRTLEHAIGFLEGLPTRRVGPDVSVEGLRSALGGPLPLGSVEATSVIDDLVRDADPGIMATAGPRFFGFVIGGAVPAALAADWLTAVWDQNAGLYAASPSASVVEEIAASWLVELFGLPAGVSTAFVTGTQMAHFTALAAARHHVLAARGWDVEERGLAGAPPIRVLASDEHHSTVDRALRYLGLGTACVEAIATDVQGRITARDIDGALRASDGPTIVCLQAGDVNSGAFDEIGAICDLAHATGAWVHVDGAFGLWARTSPTLRHLADGLERADSWTTDGHKMLNVPYDSGYAFCAHPDAHNAAVAVHASYLIHAEGRQRDQVDWTPEFSRRARGFTTYAAIKSLGRDGIASMVDRISGHARRFGELLGAEDGVEVLNDVVLNQVLVAFTDASGNDIAPAVVEGVQRDGTCWLSGSVWKGRAVMRISVSNWSTTEDDVDRSAEAIVRVFRGLRA